MTVERYTGECGCGRTVQTAVRRSSPAIAADNTARVRCRNCNKIVVATITAPETGEPIPDGGTQGAVDHDYAEAERDPAAILAEHFDDIDARTHAEMEPGDIAIDLVTRQPLRILAVAAPTIAEYFDIEDFDLGTYNQHPYLPIRVDDTVYECAFIGGLDDLHKFSDTYDYPAGRLARVPVELAGGAE